MIDPMTTCTQHADSRRWVLPFLAALVAVLATLLSSATASAATTGVAETRVGASSVVVEVPVGPPERIGAGQRLGKAVVGPGSVVATGVAAKSADDIARLTASQQRSLRSLQGQVGKHQTKLDAYRANPDAYDNLGILERAPTPEIRQRIIDGRIRHLETEIRTFQDQIDKLLGGG